MRRTAVYKDTLFLEHKTPAGHPESPERLQTIYEVLANEEIGGRFIYPHFKPVSTEILELNHSTALTRRVAATQGLQHDALDPDTHTSARSHEAACLAAGALIDGIQRIFTEEIDNAFCLVRPPGHHAERSKSMGFCLYNNIAVAASWALRELGLERIMIVDWDLHHGNGTQQSFYDTDKVLFFSVHQYPYFPGTGAVLENGAGMGQGMTVNVPLPGGEGDFEYARVFNELVVPMARLYHPELILVSCGFDIWAGDPLGDMRVTAAGIAWMTRTLVQVAEELCQGRLLITLEGGYDLTAIRNGSLAVLAELSGEPISCPWPVNLSAKQAEEFAQSKAECLFLEQALQLCRNFWSI
jgi:acetoin utilization deacetylase AcuC-like enzyme